ncbi:MAG: helix-turn-helix domain-containing protein [Pseudomonadota bacterium]
MTDASKPRIRRSPEDARRVFLTCAEAVLVSDGLSAVQMRAVARRAGVTDAALAHHFGNRDGLLSALMDHVVAKVRDAVTTIVDAWDGASSDIRTLIVELDRLYAQGYAELAQALTQSGWRDQGPPILKPVVDALIRQNQNPDTQDNDIRRVLASLHMDLALSPLYGDAFRRSVGLRSNRNRSEHLAWWATSIEQMLQAPTPRN